MAAHPAVTIRAATYVQNYGTKQQTTVSKTSVPLQRHKMTTGQPEEVVRVFNTQMDDIHKATNLARSVMPSVTFEAIPFTSGSKVVIQHGLGTSRVGWYLKSKTDATAGSSDATQNALDDTTLTLTCLGSFTADIVVEAKP